MRYQTILLFGAPGSGKGTQGKILGAVPGFYHCACGDVFRSLNLQSTMGRKFWEFSSRGELVPDAFTIDLWKQTIRGMEMVNRFHPETELLVLDGIPRNVNQAQLLDEILDVAQVIHLQCRDNAKMVERLKRRALRENRLDDAKDEVIVKRLEIYEEQTRAVLNFYDHKKVAAIDATNSQVHVLQEILKAIAPVRENFVADAAPLETVLFDDSPTLQGSLSI
jgi:adenylate kinase